MMMRREMNVRRKEREIKKTVSVQLLPIRCVDEFECEFNEKKYEGPSKAVAEQCDRIPNV